MSRESIPWVHANDCIEAWIMLCLIGTQPKIHCSWSQMQNTYSQMPCDCDINNWTIASIWCQHVSHLNSLYTFHDILFIVQLLPLSPTSLFMCSGTLNVEFDVTAIVTDLWRGMRCERQRAPDGVWGLTRYICAHWPWLYRWPGSASQPCLIMKCTLVLVDKYTKPIYPSIFNPALRPIEPHNVFSSFATKHRFVSIWRRNTKSSCSSHHDFCLRLNVNYQWEVIS